MLRLFLLATVLCLNACTDQTAKKPVKATPKAVSENGITYETTKTGKKVERAELGITIVAPDGWTKDQMDFQQRYCESSFEQLESIDGPIFCACFLEKIQYYYEPIFVKEAYSDQKKWNQVCYEAASTE